MYALGLCSKVLAVMILNISCVIISYNLRAILIFEADFNLENKLYLGGGLMKRAEILGVLTQKQHGDRSVHKSIKLAVIRILFFNYIIQTIKTVSLVLFYLENCYDYVAHNLATLTYHIFICH